MAATKELREPKPGRRGPLPGASGWLIGALCLLTVAGVKTPTQAENGLGPYAVTDLGTLNGDASRYSTYTGADDLNDAGQVIGHTDGRPFLWQDGVMQPLPLLGGTKGYATRISSDGRIVGGSETGQNDELGYPIWNSVMWQNGQITRNLTQEGLQNVTGVNSQGDVIGNNVVYLPEGVGYGYAVMLRGGQLIRLHPGSGPGVENNSTAYDINDAGEVTLEKVVGSGAQSEEYPMRWKDGSYTLLQRPPGYSVSPAAISSNGLVCGRFNAGSVQGGGFHGAFWNLDGVLTDIGTLNPQPGDYATHAEDVNAHGEVVGTSYGKAFVRKGGTLHDLNQVVPADFPWHLERAKAINDRGQILVGASPKSDLSQSRMFLLTPGTLQQPDLQVTLTDGPDPAPRGGQVSYSVTVKNGGNLAEPNATGMVDLPEGAAFLSVTSTAGTTTLQNGDISWQLGRMEPGATASLTVLVKPTEQTLLFASAHVRGGSNEGLRFNNGAFVETWVEESTAEVDLAVTQTDGPDPIHVGHEVTYTVRVRNNAADTAPFARVIHEPFEHIEFVSATGSQGSLESTAGGKPTWLIGDLGGGSEATVRFVYRGKSAGTGVAVARVESIAMEADATNDIAINDTQILAGGGGGGGSEAADLTGEWAPFRLRKQKDPKTKKKVWMLSGAFVLRNDGTATATKAEVYFYVSTPSGPVKIGSGSATNLNPGTSKRLTFSKRVKVAVTGGSVFKGLSGYAEVDPHDRVSESDEENNTIDSPSLP